MGWFDRLMGPRDLPYSDDDGPDDGLPFSTYAEDDLDVGEEGGHQDEAYYDEDEEGIEGVEFGLDEPDYWDDDDEDERDDW